jgi:hypothetical protein
MRPRHAHICSMSLVRGGISTENGRVVCGGRHKYINKRAEHTGQAIYNYIILFINERGYIFVAMRDGEGLVDGEGLAVCEASLVSIASDRNHWVDPMRYKTNT